MSDNSATIHSFKFFIETCRHTPFGKVMIRTTNPHPYVARYRAERAVARRYGKPRICAHCGHRSLEVQFEPFEERYPNRDAALAALDDSNELHERKAPIGLRNRNASVFRVVTCTGALIGFVTVFKKGTIRETKERAYRTMVRRFGKPHECECGDPSHELTQVSGPGFR